MKFSWDSQISCATERKSPVVNPVEHSRVRRNVRIRRIFLVLLVVVVFVFDAGFAYKVLEMLYGF